MREGTEKYNDSDKGGYSYSEKLALVAQGVMDPQEIGLPPNTDGNAAGQKAAINEITGQESVGAKLSDFVTFEASVIPQELRAHWARMDMKVMSSGITSKEWEQNWLKEHKGEYAIQGSMHSGTCHATIQRLYADPIIGFVEMMRQSADLLEAKYEELKRKDPNPIITRTDKGRDSGDNQPDQTPEGKQQAPK